MGRVYRALDAKIGEASKKVPEAITDFYPGVPWKKMIKAGFFSPIDSLGEIV